MTDNITAARLIVENPIHKAAAIQPVRPVSAGGGAACRRVPADGVHILDQLPQEVPLLQQLVQCRNLIAVMS